MKNYKYKLNNLDKSINNLIYNISKENNICMNNIGNIKDKSFNNLCRDEFIDNINVLEILKQKLYFYINLINQKMLNYDNNIKLIKLLNSNNNYIQDIDVCSNLNSNTKNINKLSTKINNKIQKQNITIKKVAGGVSCLFHQVNNLDEIKPCIYWLNKNCNNTINKGFYMCLYDNVYIKLKLRLNSFSEENNPDKIFLCSKKYKNICKKTNKKCYNIHYGDKIKRIKYNNINCNMFGNTKTLAKDLEAINTDSIKILTSYLSSDILSLYTWFDKYKREKSSVKIILSEPFILKKNSIS